MGDITSNYDIIGPYYTRENGLDHKFIMACVFEIMHLFFMYGFVTLLICHGARANLKLESGYHTTAEQTIHGLTQTIENCKI